MDERPPWDRHDEDDDAPAPPGPPTEGVRIIGAEEAAEAIERGDVAQRRPSGAPRFGDRPAGPPPESPRPALRFPLGASSDPSDIARPPVTTPPPPVAPPAAELPHWTDPPTGEVPKIVPTGGSDGGAAPEEGDELEAWSSFASGPRWRDHPGDWDEPDFDEAGMLHDDETRIGALDESERPAPDDFFAMDDDPEPIPTPISTRTRSRSVSATAPTGRTRAPAQSEIGASERDVRTAVITGLTFAVVALICFAIGPAAVVLLVSAVVVAAAAELYGALQRKGHQPATLLGLVAVAAFVGAAYWKGETAFPLVLALTLVFGMLWYLTGVTKVAPTLNLGLTVLGVVWIGMLGAFAALLLKFPNDQGLAYLLGAILATVAHDVGSLFAGRRLGRSLMAPTISPNKTWEGLIGGTLCTIVVSVLILGVVPGVHPWDVGSALALGLVVSVAAPLGDLSESLVKRDLDLKDMGSVLPGHGGLLDRFDAILFVLPAVYYLVRFLEIGL